MKLIFHITHEQVSRPCKAFAYNSIANVNVSETQLSKIMQLGAFLDALKNAFAGKNSLLGDFSTDVLKSSKKH